MKKLAKVGCAIAVMIGAIGVLHMPIARPLLMKIGGCPVGKASAADVDLIRKQSVNAMRGTAESVAPSRPALGFALEGTTVTDVQTWASMNQVSCSDQREGMLVVCKDVPARLLNGRSANEVIDEVSFAFRPGDQKLVNVTAMSYGVAPNDAAARVSHITENLDADLGAPTSRDGEMSAERLSKGGYTTSMASYRFRDYVAEVSATSFDGSTDNKTVGVVLREHYVSAN
jgi:hypothetical protein